jgi:hypothetical protein
MPLTDEEKEAQQRLRSLVNELRGNTMAKQASGVARLKEYAKAFGAVGAKSITLEYDGSGDSGDMHSATVAYKPKTDKCLSECSDEERAEIAEGKLKTMSLEKFCKKFEAELKQHLQNDDTTANVIESEITEEAFELLPGGWEINEGSFGTVLVDAASGDIAIEHNERITEYNTENFTF